MPDRGLGAVVGEQGHSLPSRRPRQHSAFFPWFCPDGTTGENLAMHTQTWDILGPRFAATFTLVCVVLESDRELGQGTGATVWEASAKGYLAA